MSRREIVSSASKVLEFKQTGLEVIYDIRALKTPQGTDGLQTSSLSGILATLLEETLQKTKGIEPKYPLSKR
jgi:hypothetical protein